MMLAAVESGGETDPKQNNIDQILELEKIRVELIAERLESARLRERLAFHVAEEAKYRNLAYIDPLTRIGNRAHLQREYEAVTAHHSGRISDKQPRAGGFISCLMLDIDHFKLVNDELGHDEGDVVLGGVARVGATNIRKRDIIGRFGGEEFAVILPRVSLEHAYVIAENIRSAVECTEFGPNKRRVTVSIGVGNLVIAAAGNPPLEVGQAFALADRALYRAKGTDEAGGRNRVVVNYDQHLPEAA